MSGNKAVRWVGDHYPKAAAGTKEVLIRAYCAGVAAERERCIQLAEQHDAVYKADMYDMDSLSFADLLRQ